MSVFVVEVREDGHGGSMIFADVVAESKAEACKECIDFYLSMCDDEPALTATARVVRDTKDMH